MKFSTIEAKYYHIKLNNKVTQKDQYLINIGFGANIGPFVLAKKFPTEVCLRPPTAERQVRHGGKRKVSGGEARSWRREEGSVRRRERRDEVVEERIGSGWRGQG